MNDVPRMRLGERTDNRHSMMTERDSRAIQRQADREVIRPIERIHKPCPLVIASMTTGFFGNNRMARKARL